MKHKAWNMKNIIPSQLLNPDASVGTPTLRQASGLITMLNLLKTFFLIATLILGTSQISAWTGPSATPPGSNAPQPINVGDLTQIKKGNLIIEGLNALNQPYQNGLVISYGNVGVGTLTPKQKIAVNGIVGVREACITNASGDIVGPCLSGATPPLAKGSAVKIATKSLNNLAAVGVAIKNRQILNCKPKAGSQFELVCTVR